MAVVRGSVLQPERQNDNDEEFSHDSTPSIPGVPLSDTKFILAER